jgi:hypothetical protein
MHTVDFYVCMVVTGAIIFLCNLCDSHIFRGLVLCTGTWSAGRKASWPRGLVDGPTWDEKNQWLLHVHIAHVVLHTRCITLPIIPRKIESSRFKQAMWSEFLDVSDVILYCESLGHRPTPEGSRRIPLQTPWLSGWALNPWPQRHKGQGLTTRAYEQCLLVSWCMNSGSWWYYFGPPLLNSILSFTRGGLYFYYKAIGKIKEY